MSATLASTVKILALLDPEASVALGGIAFSVCQHLGTQGQES